MPKYHLAAQTKKALKLIGRMLTVKTKLKARKDLEHLEGNSWLALSDNPQFVMESRKLKKGWYQLQVDLSVRQHNIAKLYPLYAHQELDESKSIEIPLKPTKGSNRFFYIEDNLAQLRFNPLETTGDFTIQQCHLIKIPEFYAYRRLLIRVKNLHPEMQSPSLKHLKAHLKQLAKEHNTHWKTEALQAYNQTFSKAETAESYLEWIKHIEQNKLHKFIAQLPKSCAWKPIISIVMPTYNTQPAHLSACIESVLKQTYPNWQLCIVDDASSKTEHISLIQEYVKNDSRILFHQKTVNGHISQASNEALDLATGDFTLLLDHDDLLCTHTLNLFVDAINKHPKSKLFYADEDKVDEYGNRFMPHFKPDWNPDLLYSQNYIGHPVVYKTEKLKEIGGFREGVEGSQDHDLLLRYSQNLNTSQIEHLPWILYHWRATKNSTALNIDSKNYTTQAGIKSLQDFFDSQNKSVKVEAGNYPNTYRCQWPLPKNPPLVSLLIPTRDGYQILKNAVDSILEKTHYTNYEILILNNRSKCQQTLDYFKELDQKYPNIRILDWHHPFNYSAINNYGVEKAYGEIIGLINNDIEVINKEWLTEMVSHAIRPEIGCVGAKLYYPDNTIQHAGVILGIGGVAGHAHKYFSKENPGYFSRLHLTQNYSAVTAACLLVKKSIYKKVGGLNAKHLTIAFNDVDFCLKVREAGYKNLFTPWAELYHHESISRGAEDTPKKTQRFSEEVKFMKDHWHTSLRHDPAYNRNLSQTHENFTLKNN